MNETFFRRTTKLKVLFSPATEIYHFSTDIMNMPWPITLCKVLNYKNLNFYILL